MFHELNKSDLKGVPLYVQIREKIRDKIKKNELEVGAFLPAETELAEMFNVSRMTVRSAIDDLVSDGLLIRKQGTGTIVASKRLERDYSRLTGFYEDMKARGMNPSSKLLSIEEVTASGYYAEKLMVPMDSPLFHVLRMRYVENNDIVALHSLHIPKNLCPWVANANLSRDSLYELYNKNDVPVEWGKQLVEARSASSEIAQYLDVEIGTPILYTERISFTKNNVPLEHAVAWCRADRYTINLSLRR